MAKNLQRKIQQIFRVDEGELDLIKRKMEAARIINKEAYYRKMVLEQTWSLRYNQYSW